MKKFFALAILIVLLFVSCTTKSTSNEELFQYLGTDEKCVVTAKSDLTKNKRVSFYLSDDLKLSGVIELSSYPKILINSYFVNNGFELKKDKFNYYFNKDSNLSVCYLSNGLLLFSESDICKVYDKLITDRKKGIDDINALKMKSSKYSVFISDVSFVKKLTSLFDDFNLSDFENLLVVSKDLSLCDLSCTFYSESKASSFGALIKAKEIQKLKLAGQKPDYKILNAKFGQNDREYVIKDIEIADFLDLKLLNTISDLIEVI